MNKQEAIDVANKTIVGVIGDHSQTVDEIILITLESLFSAGNMDGYKEGMDRGTEIRKEVMAASREN